MLWFWYPIGLSLVCYCLIQKYISTYVGSDLSLSVERLQRERCYSTIHSKHHNSLLKVFQIFKKYRLICKICVIFQLSTQLHSAPLSFVYNWKEMRTYWLHTTLCRLFELLQIYGLKVLPWWKNVLTKYSNSLFMHAVPSIKNAVKFWIVVFRGGGTGGAGGATAPPTFGSSIILHSYSTTNIFGQLNIC